MKRGNKVSQVAYVPFQAEVWTNKRPPTPYSSKSGSNIVFKPAVRDSHTPICPSFLVIRRLDDWETLNPISVNTGLWIDLPCCQSYAKSAVPAPLEEADALSSSDTFSD